MKSSIKIIKYLVLFLYINVLSCQNIHGQEFLNPQEIINSFRNALLNSKEDDKLDIYSEYIHELVGRGNYVYADSIFSLFENDSLEIADSSSVIPIIKNRAFMNKANRRYSKALEDYIWIKDFYTKRGENQQLIEANNLLAEYYRAVGNYKLSLLHLDYAKSLFKEVKPETENLAYWYSRKAAWCNEAIRNGDSVLVYAEFGLELALQTDDYYTQALLLNELGYTVIAQNKNVQRGLDYLSEAQEILYKNQRYREYVEVSNNIANYYFRINEDDIALNILKEVIAIAKENKWFGPLQKSLEMTTGIYIKQNDTISWDRDLHSLYETRIINQDLLFNILKDELALNYEKELAEKELDVQAEKTKNAQERASIIQNRYFVSIQIALSLLLIAAISFWFNVRLKKNNNLLKTQRLQISKSNNELEESLNQQKLLFKELNHRVKNNLTVLSGLVYLQEVSETDKDSKKAFLTLRNRIQSIALAHQSLYDSENQSRINFQVYLTDLFNELNQAFVTKQSIETRIECNGLNLDLKQAIPLAMIANELFTNSIKHAFHNVKNAKISVSAFNEGEQIVFEYSDNGNGILNEQKSKKALGLSLISLLLDQLKAQIQDLNPSKGVHMKITIPYQSILIPEI